MLSSHRLTNNWHGNTLSDQCYSTESPTNEHRRQGNLETLDESYIFRDKVMDQRLLSMDVHSRQDYQEMAGNSAADRSKRDMLSMVSPGQYNIAGSVGNEMQMGQFHTSITTLPSSLNAHRVAYDAIQQTMQSEASSSRLPASRLAYEGGLRLRQSETPSSLSIRRSAYEGNQQGAMSENTSSLSSRRLAYEEANHQQITQQQLANNTRDQILQSSRHEDPGQYDVAVAETVPAALQLIADLRGDGNNGANVRLQNAVEDILRKYLGNGISSPEVMERDNNNITAQTKDKIELACQFCDQALFLLVEWARRAHFFRQLTVSSVLP